MLSIILNDNELDLFEDTEIVWQWTAFRFQTAIRDAFTNNFSIPKTNHNIQVFGVYSLFDQPGVQFEGRLQPAVINLNGVIMPIYIQVVSINEKEIELCIFEDRLIYTIKGSELGHVQDTPETILRWDKYANLIYHNEIQPYNYGTYYNPNFAQYHPSIPLNDIFDEIGRQHNVTVQHINPVWRVICTKRVVCPENNRQVIEFNTTGSLEDNLFTCFGGQHITNDLCAAGVTEIEFNRHTVVNFRIWYSFYKKSTCNRDNYVIMIKNGSTLHAIPLYSDTYTSWSGEYGCNDVVFEAGDKLSFRFDYGNMYKSVSFVIRMDHSDYEITEDDYDNEELEYKGRQPRLKTWQPGDEWRYTYFDGATHIATANYLPVNTEALSFSYFGMWCNLPKFTIGELLYSLQYILNCRVVQREDTIYFDVFNERAAEVEGELNNLVFHSSYVGQKNFVRWKDGSEQLPIVELTNEWLVKEKVWSTSVFKWIKSDAVVPQYTLKLNDTAETPEEWIEYEYEEIEEPVLLFFGYPSPTPPTLQNFGLSRINNCKEIQFTPKVTPPDITELDTVYIDGREYYILEGEKNFKTNVTTIKALLVI